MIEVDVSFLDQYNNKNTIQYHEWNALFRQSSSDYFQNCD